MNSDTPSDTMWHSRHISSQKFLLSFSCHQNGYQLEVVDTKLRHWREIATHKQLTERCEEFSIFELNTAMLIEAMEQELFYGTKGNIEIVEISDKHLQLVVNTIKTVRVNTVLYLDRVGEFDKLDREWVVDNFMPLLALYAHRESGTQPLDSDSQDSVSSNILLPCDVKTFEIFGEEVTRKKYLKYKTLLKQKDCLFPTSDAISSKPEVTPPAVHKTTTTTTKKQTATPEEVRRDEQTRREELSKKRTTAVPTAVKKKRRLL